MNIKELEKTRVERTQKALSPTQIACVRETALSNSPLHAVEQATGFLLKNFDIQDFPVDVKRILSRLEIDYKEFEGSGAIGPGGGVLWPPRSKEERYRITTSPPDSEQIKRHVIGHELGHFVLDGILEPLIDMGKISGEERRQYLERFARALLLPRSWCEKQWNANLYTYPLENALELASISQTAPPYTLKRVVEDLCLTKDSFLTIHTNEHIYPYGSVPFHDEELFASREFAPDEGSLKKCTRHVLERHMGYLKGLLEDWGVDELYTDDYVREDEIVILAKQKEALVWYETKIHMGLVKQNQHDRFLVFQLIKGSPRAFIYDPSLLRHFKDTVFLEVYPKI